MKILVLLPLLFILLTPEKVDAFSRDSFWEYLYQSFDFIPEYHIDADLYMFLLHKNSYFKERYYLESDINIDLMLISFRDLVYIVWDFKIQIGMGKTPQDIIFDPADAGFGITTIIEFRPAFLNFQCGLDHECFHEIDRRDYNTVYWNKPFFTVGSKNMRLYDYWSNLAVKDGWTYANRFSWYFNWGYYLRKFFGFIKEDSINGVNKYVHDAMLDIRYAFYRRRSWIFNARGKTIIGYWENLAGQPKDSGTYWRQDFSIESNFGRSERGGMIFIIYTLDALPKYQGKPRFSKDRLLQIGIRIFI